MVGDKFRAGECEGLGRSTALDNNLRRRHEIRSAIHRLCPSYNCSSISSNNGKSVRDITNNKSSGINGLKRTCICLFLLT